MKGLFFISFALITIFVSSCDKKDDEILHDRISIKGTWNESFVKWVDNEGKMTIQESLDTIRLTKLSIGNSVIQELYIDSTNSFYFLMYSTYKLNNGILMQFPDSLLDIEMKIHYLNSIDSMFENFPVFAYPFESKIEQSNTKVFIEKRRMGESGGVDIEYHKLDDNIIDLKIEFETCCNNLKNAKISDKDDLQFDDYRKINK